MLKPLRGSQLMFDGGELPPSRTARKSEGYWVLKSFDEASNIGRFDTHGSAEGYAKELIRKGYLKPNRYSVYYMPPR